MIGTGSVKGVYYPIAGAICRLLNRAQQLHKVRCSVESTSGSVYNLKELRKGNFGVVVAQSDWQYKAYKGVGPFEKSGANETLRAVFALEADPLALLVNADSTIKVFDDLQDNVVGLGYDRSLQSRIFQDLLDVKKWQGDRFKEIKRMSDNKQIATLCSKQVDAVLLLSSSLNDHLSDISENCQLRFIALDDHDVHSLIKAKPYYRSGTLNPADFFETPVDEGTQTSGLAIKHNETQQIMSFGLGATFVAQQSASPKAIYHMVKEIVENFKDFQSLHPSLQHIKKQQLPYAGISAPLHPGAIRYYKEARLLKH